MKKHKKLALRSEVVRVLDLAMVRGGDGFTSAIGCPSAFASDCCTVQPSALTMAAAPDGGRNQTCCN